MRYKGGRMQRRPPFHFGRTFQEWCIGRPGAARNHVNWSCGTRQWQVAAQFRAPLLDKRFRHRLAAATMHKVKTVSEAEKVEQWPRNHQAPTTCTGCRP